MSVEDFCGMTPEEFGVVANAWRETRKEQWEQVRTLAAFSIAPWNSKNVSIESLMPLPWDKKRKTEETVELTPEEKKRRYEEALKRRGLKTMSEAPSANASGTVGNVRSDGCD